MDISLFTQKIYENEATFYRVAKSILPCDSDCEDAVSESILKAYTKLYTLREDAYFTTWFIRILMNECYQIRRRKRETVDIQSLENTLTTKPPDYDADLYQAILSLPDKVRMAVVLYYVEGYRIEEIKQILHIPAGTVKSRLSKGRYLLRKCLESEEEHEKSILAESLYSPACSVSSCRGTGLKKRESRKGESHETKQISF